MTRKLQVTIANSAKQNQNKKMPMFTMDELHHIVSLHEFSNHIPCAQILPCTNLSLCNTLDANSVLKACCLMDSTKYQQMWSPSLFLDVSLKQWLSTWTIQIKIYNLIILPFPLVMLLFLIILHICSRGTKWCVYQQTPVPQARHITRPPSAACMSWFSFTD